MSLSVSRKRSFSSFSFDITALRGWGLPDENKADRELFRRALRAAPSAGPKDLKPCFGKTAHCRIRIEPELLLADIECRAKFAEGKTQYPFSCKYGESKY